MTSNGSESAMPKAVYILCLIFLVTFFHPWTARAQGDPLASQNMPSINQNASSYPANIWVTDGMTKVQQRTGSPGSVKWYVGNAAQNEWTEFQIHEQAGGANVTLNATASDLVNSQTGTHIPASTNIVMYKEVYYNVVTLSDQDGVTGYIPDILVPSTDPYTHQTTNAFPITVTSGQNQSLWFDVLIPKNAPAGYYSGTVTVTNNGNTYATIPVVIGVWGFSLPSASSLPSFYSSDRGSAAAGYYTTNGNESAGYTNSTVYPGAAGSGETAKTMMNLGYAVLLADHRMSASESNYPWPDSGASNNWSTFDYYFGPILLGHNNPNTINPVMAGAQLLNWDYNAHDGNAANIQNWMQHAQTAGYPSPFDYLCDEGGCDQPGTFANANAKAYNGCGLGAGPSSSIPMPLLATRGISDAKAGGYLQCINWLVPNIYTVQPYQQANTSSSYPAWEETNSPAPFTKFGMYQACNGHDYNLNNCNNVGTVPPIYPSNMIDASPVRNRIMQWMEFLDGAQADLYYSIDYCWYQSGGTGGGCTASLNSGQCFDVWQCIYYSGGNGDGTLIYPGSYAKIGTGSSANWTPFPLPSIRLKLTRDGFQDYEYLLALQKNGQGSFAISTAGSFITNSYTFNESSAVLTGARVTLGTKLHQLTLGAAPAPPTALSITVQ